MHRLPVAIGVLLLLALGMLAPLGWWVIPSCLGAWLFVLSLPAGALLLICGLSALPPRCLTPVRLEAVLQPLRALLPQVPAAALLGILLLLCQLAGAGRTDPAMWPQAGFRHGWFAPGAVMLRLAVVLALWSSLAMAMLRPVRHVVAGLAFVVLLATGCSAALDQVPEMASGPALFAVGPAVLSGWALSALSLATLAARPPVRAGLCGPLLAAIGVWTAASLALALLVWTAGLPSQTAWYRHRVGGLGTLAVTAAGLLPLLALAIGLVPLGRVLRLGVPLTLLSALALLVRLLESLWLVTPSARGQFELALPDLLALAGSLALLGGLARAGWLPGWRRVHAGR